MDLSSDPLSSPPGSSLPDIDLLDPGETPNNVSSPTLPTSDARPTAAFTLDSHSSDPLTGNPLFPATERSAATHRLSRIPNKKRGPSSLAPKLALLIDKTPCFDFTLTPNTSSSSSAKDAILQARDLLVKAYTLSDSRAEQSRLLDLLEIFREYTEKGKLQTTSAIIASQVANLEQATRQIESKARTLAKTQMPSLPSITSTTSMPRQPPLGTGTGPGPSGPPGPPGTTLETAPGTTPSFASVASTGTSSSSSSYEWTTVQPKAKSKPKAEKPTKSNRLILV